MADKIMLNLQEAAEYTALSYHFWWTACKQRKIRYVRAGNRYLIHRDNIDQYLRMGEQVADKAIGQ